MAKTASWGVVVALAVLVTGVVAHAGPVGPLGGLVGSQGLSGASTVAVPFVDVVGDSGSHGGSGSGSSSGSCPTSLPSATGVSYTPSELQKAYSYSSSSSATGSGETIAIIDAYGSPTISSDLACFDKMFGLPSPTLTVVHPFGTISGSNSGWALETALDVEWAHAMAPAASILLIETPSASLTYLINDAIPYAVSNGASVISMSWGAAENSASCSTWTGETSVFEKAASAGAILLAASGDDGGKDGTSSATVNYPAADPYVVGVGGTTLSVTSAGAYSSETVWNDRAGASGGGVSACFSEPSYQSSASIKVTKSSGAATPKGRAVPDISYDADPYTGVWVYDTTGYSGWVQVGGTSAASPQWAAIFADALSYGDSVTGGTVHGLLYGLLGSSSVHDVTSGNNGVYDASSGYDACTGVGTPAESAVLAAL
jgi:subtilase family serine protease